MAKYLVTGIKSGLGKYLYENLPDTHGLDRGGFNLIKDEEYDTIIHCAFNKAQTSTDIGDHYGYLEDNILLTQDLLKLKYRKFIYISTIDVYPPTPNVYGLFKIFAESIIKQKPGTIILRCSMILGENTKPNHITKLKDGIDRLTLSSQSKFNYILNSDILKFIESYSLRCPEGIIDFVANKPAKLGEVASMISPNTKLLSYTYNANYKWFNPIYDTYEEFNKSSIDNLNQYLNG
jgi:nucleoside-diphosphate-sugar epimerase